VLRDLLYTWLAGDMSALSVIWAVCLPVALLVALIKGK
jgi:hypothetical protein